MFFVVVLSLSLNQTMSSLLMSYQPTSFFPWIFPISNRCFSHWTILIFVLHCCHSQGHQLEDLSDRIALPILHETIHRDVWKIPIILKFVISSNHVIAKYLFIIWGFIHIIALDTIKVWRTFGCGPNLCTSPLITSSIEVQIQYWNS